MEPLISDARRQAVPTLKAFSYQIWQSLLSWVSLDEATLLVLEGAEDLDLLGPGQSETVQVKTSTDPVTLRSAAIQEAISHYWEHQQANSDHHVVFRFLTMAERGNERSDAFDTRRGLDVWDSCKYEGVDCTELRYFLSSLNSLSEPVLAFIRNASDEDLRSQLLKRIEWHTGAKEMPYVEAAVNRIVSAYGDRVFDLSWSESESVVPHLLDHTWRTACKPKDRRLDRAMFLRIFEDAITERIPKPELRQLRRDAMKMMELRAQGLSGETSTVGVAAIVTHPDLEIARLFVNKRLLIRGEVVRDCERRLNSGGVLVLRGSAGMGKSTLADQVAASAGGSWRKLDFRGVEAREVAQQLTRAADRIEDNRLQVDCIIDDLNFDNNSQVYENPLARFIYSVKNAGGRIVITTQGTVPSRIVNLYDVPPDNMISVPALTENEIKRLARSYGCTGDTRVKDWARIIYLSSRGHPQLAHARVRNLESRAWPAHTKQDIAFPPDIEAVRREVRNQLRDLLPSNEARSLLYRLSILTHFRKKEAVSLAGYEPQIPLAGEMFDSLIGPWIEQIGSERFRLSPLLDNAASEVFRLSQIKELHVIAAESYLQQETIDISDFNALLLHGFLGEAQKPLLAAVLSLQKIPEDERKHLMQAVGWFARVSTGAGEKLFPDQVLNAMLRLEQFKVAADLDPRHAARIAEIFMREIGDLDNPALHPDTRRGTELTFLMNALFSRHVPFPIETLVAYLIRIIHLLRNDKPFFEEAPDFDPQRQAEVRSNMDARVFVQATFGKCATIGIAVDFLATLNKQPFEDAKEIWDVLDEDNYVTMLLLDSLWLNEARLAQPNWDNCLERLDEAIAIAKSRNCAAFAAAAFRAKAIVHEEYLKNKAAAIDTLNEGAEYARSSAVFLEDYRGKIFFIEDEFEKALAIWRRILPVLEQKRQLGRSFSYRDAEICAAKIGEWETAAEFARLGEIAAREPWSNSDHNAAIAPIMGVMAVGFKADYGFALWKTGKRSEGLKEFCEILEAFKSLPSSNIDEKIDSLYRRVQYGIGWLARQGPLGSQMEEPPPAFFSNPEVVEQVEGTSLPLIMLWYLLAKLEFQQRLGDSIFRKLEQEIADNSPLSGRVGYGHLKIDHALAGMDFDNVVSDSLRYAADLKKCAEESDVENSAWSYTAELQMVLFAALIQFVFSGQLHTAPLRRWKKQIRREPRLNSDLVSWLDYIASLTSAETVDIVKIFRDTLTAGERRIVAALVASARSDIDPENRFYANVLLTISDLNSPWLEVSANPIAKLVSDGWRQTAINEKFALKNPSVTSPRIIAECDNTTSGGLKKAARVLLEAHNAVNIRVRGFELQQLQSLSE